jgi:hypothetical protein
MLIADLGPPPPQQYAQAFAPNYGPPQQQAPPPHQAARQGPSAAGAAMMGAATGFAVGRIMDNRRRPIPVVWRRSFPVSLTSMMSTDPMALCLALLTRSCMQVRHFHVPMLLVRGSAAALLRSS